MGNTCLNIMKCVFIALNVLLLLLGLASLGVGIWMAVDPEHYIIFTELGDIGTGQLGLVRISGYILIAAGGATVLIALLGFVAAKTENGILYGFYAVILLIVVGVELSAGIIGILFKREWEQRLMTEVQQQIDTRYDGQTNTADTFTAALDAVQREMNCCGLRNSSDFDTASKWNRSTETGEDMKIPPSCCYDYRSNDTCTIYPTNENAYAAEGCRQSIEDLMRKYSIVIIAVAITTVGIQVLLIMLSVCLLTGVRSGYTLDEKYSS